MTDTDMSVFTIKAPVIGTASDGSSWVGTQCWLLRSGSMTLHQKAEAMDRVVAADFAVPMERVRHGAVSVVRRDGDEIHRGYERPDGITVWLDDAIVSYFEEYLEDEDEEGCTTPVDLVVRQVQNRWGSVGFFLRDELVAVCAPIMGINAHMTDGKGGSVEDTSYEHPAHA